MVDISQAHQQQKIGHRSPRQAIQPKPRYPSRAYSVMRRRVKGLGRQTMGEGPLNKWTGGGLNLVAWCLIFCV